MARHPTNAAPTATQIFEQHAARDLTNLHKTAAEIEAARALLTVQEQFHLPTWDSGLERELKRMVTEDRRLSAGAPSSWLNAMKHSVRQRHQPWFNELEPRSSIRAMAEIHHLAVNLLSAGKYSFLPADLLCSQPVTACHDLRYKLKNLADTFSNG